MHISRGYAFKSLQVAICHVWEARMFWVHVSIEPVSVYLVLFLPRKNAWRVKKNCFQSTSSLVLHLVWCRDHTIFASNINSHLYLLRFMNRYASIATNTIKTSCPLSRDLAIALNVILGLPGINVIIQRYRILLTTGWVKTIQYLYPMLFLSTVS